MLSRRRALQSLVTASLLAAICQVRADVITWSTPGTTWDTSTATWTGDDTIYSDGDTVTFANTGNTAITIQASGVVPASTTFASNAQNYTFTGGAITAGTVTVNGGTQTFNNSVNTYSGATTINVGTLVIGTASGITNSTATINVAGTLSFAGSANNTRYGDSNAINLYGGTLRLSNTSGSAISETVGDLNFRGNAVIAFTRNGTAADDLVTLRFNPIRQERGILVISTNNTATLGVQRQWAFVTGTEPTVTNGMVAPYHIISDTATNPVASFATYGTTDVVAGQPSKSFKLNTFSNASAATAMNTSGITGSGTDSWSVAASGSLSGTEGAGSLAVNGNKDIYALRTFRSLSSASGSTITLNSGGLILQPNTSVSGDPALNIGPGISFILPTGVEGVFYAGGVSSKTHNIKGAISGDSGLTKGGVAGLILSSTNNTYTGTTTVNAGTLTINGSIADGMAHIAAGATLNGSGTINYQIANNTADLITVKGILDITNLNLNLQLSGTQTSGTTYVLADYTAGALAGSSFASTNIGSLTGWSINYDDGDRITLTYNTGVTRSASLTGGALNTRRDDFTDATDDLENNTGSNAQRVFMGVEVDGLNTDINTAVTGSVFINPGPDATGRTYVAMWLTGGDTNVNALINELDDDTAYFIRGLSVGETSNITLTEWNYVQTHLGGTGTFGNFNVLFAFDNPAGSFFNWDFTGAGVGVEAVAAIPEPTSLALLGLGAAALVMRRRRS